MTNPPAPEGDQLTIDWADKPGPGKLTLPQFKALMAHLNPNRIASRLQSGNKLSYLQAWDVRAALIRVFGFGGFSIETLRSEIYSMERDIPKSGGGTTAFRATAMATVQLSLPQLGARYSETAMSSQSGAVPGDVGDFALKTAVSDAMKRCCINLGTQFGLSLYNAGSPRDVIGIVFEPTQAGYLAELDAERADPTPQHAIEGINSPDPDTPAGVEVEATPDFLALALKATTANEALVVWRGAKRAGAPESILAAISAHGETLRAREEGETAPADPEKVAGEALQSGFGAQS